MKPRKGYDARVHKPVVVIGEVAGLKLFSGTENRMISTAARKRLARNLSELCRAHKIKPEGLGLSLSLLGQELLYRTRKPCAKEKKP